MSVAAKRKATKQKVVVKPSSPKVYDDIISDKVGNYEKHPFFVKKANEMKKFIARVGLPERFAHKTK